MKSKVIALKGAICTNEKHRQFVKVRLLFTDDEQVILRFVDKDGNHHKGYLQMDKVNFARLHIEAVDFELEDYDPAIYGHRHDEETYEIITRRKED